MAAATSATPRVEQWFAWTVSGLFSNPDSVQQIVSVP